MKINSDAITAAQLSLLRSIERPTNSNSKTVESTDQVENSQYNGFFSSENTTDFQQISSGEALLMLDAWEDKSGRSLNLSATENVILKDLIAGPLKDLATFILAPLNG